MSIVGEDGVATVTLPSGEVDSYKLGPDPRFGMASPLIAASTTTMPSGRTRSTATSRTAELSDPADPLSLKRLVETTVVNGRSSSMTYDAATHSLIARSTSGAESTTVIDDERRPTRFELPGIDPVDFTYDADGRVTGRYQGNRIWRYTYAASARGQARRRSTPTTTRRPTPTTRRDA